MEHKISWSEVYSMILHATPRTDIQIIQMNCRLNISMCTYILLLFCLHRRFIFNNHLTGEAWCSLFDFIDSVAVFGVYLKFSLATERMDKS